MQDDDLAPAVAPAPPVAPAPAQLIPNAAAQRPFRIGDIVRLVFAKKSIANRRFDKQEAQIESINVRKILVRLIDSAQGDKLHTVTKAQCVLVQAAVVPFPGDAAASSAASAPASPSSAAATALDTSTAASAPEKKELDTNAYAEQMFG